MNTLLAQLKQWPPTSTTVYGIAIVVAAISYAVTGSLEFAAFVAGFAKIILPQDAPTIDHAMQQARDAERELATAPKP